MVEISDSLRELFIHSNIVTQFQCTSILGMGSNAIILSGVYLDTQVAIKILTHPNLIRKRKYYSEVEDLKECKHKNINTIWHVHEDIYFTCFIQNNYGTDWIDYKNKLSLNTYHHQQDNKLILKIKNKTLSGTLGSHDLWAWKAFEKIRCAIWNVSNETYSELLTQIINQVTEALRYLHSKCITHGDLKIENILAFTPQLVAELKADVAYNIQIKLCDFGFVNTKLPRDDLMQLNKLIKNLKFNNYIYETAILQ